MVVVVGSLRDITNLGFSYVRRCMISVASREVSRISQNDKNATVPSTLLVPYIQKYYGAVIVTNKKTTLSQNSNT